MSDKELADLYDSYEKIYEATDRTKPKPTVLPRSRETNIGDQTVKGWNDPSMAELDWDRNPTVRPSNRKAQAIRLRQVIGTQRRQDKEAGLRTEARTDISYAREAIRNARENLKKYPQGHRGDDFSHEHKLAKGAFKNLVNQERGKLENSVEYVLDYLIDEGFTDSYDSALVILETMSEQWLVDLIESAKEQSDKQIDKGVKTTYKAQNVLDNLHQGRSRIDRRERDAKVERMRGRLKTRRDDLFAERGRREEEKMAKLKKLLGM
jgi:hypothetical protein